MQKNILLILFILFSLKAGSQTYSSRKAHYSVDIYNDTAHVEVFRVHHWVVKIHDEYLVKQATKKDTIFKGKQSYIFKKKGELFLYCKTPYWKQKVKLGIHKYDYRSEEAHLDYVQKQLDKLNDSLSGPFTLQQHNYAPLRMITKDKSYRAYVYAVNKTADSITTEMVASKNPAAIAAYNQMDSLASIDSIKVYSLLSKTDYNSFYGKKLLFEVSKRKPEHLIRYVDKKPQNKDIILDVIRNDSKSNAIVANVKKSKLNTVGKHEITRQKTKRVAGNVAGGIVVSLLIIGEIALVLFLISLAL